MKSVKIFKWTCISILVGILAGVASAIFLISLEWVTHFRNAHPEIIYGLPIIGFVIGWMYFKFGSEIHSGHNLILDEIHDPKNIVPFKMAPFIYLGTLFTHLFGGSAGREGTAVQIGATFADQLSSIFIIEPNERKILLISGAGAGFGAAIGTPFAGALFGMEVINVGKLRLHTWFECFISSFVAFYIAKLIGANHAQYPQLKTALSFKIFCWVFLSGIIFGVSAKIFTILTHLIEKFHMKFIPYSPLRPFLGGCLLLILYHLEGSFQYVGLGIPKITEGLESQVSLLLPLLKSIFTAITIGSGFKGGEFIPLVFIGTTLGSALSIFIPVSFQLLASLGFFAVFAGASNTPIACSILGIEIFGWEIAPYAILACFVSYYFSGQRGIYKNQNNDFSKWKKLLS